MSLDGIRAGFCMCGSFCTFKKAFAAAEALAAAGCELLPVMSFNAASISSRFGSAEENLRRLSEICGKSVITSIEGAEPIGPKKLTDILIVAPCTGNTLAKLSNGITDTPVTMAVKSHLRNNRPVVVALSTNDALSAAAKNIGALLSLRNYYFVPFSQDDCEGKPRSCVADFTLLPDTVAAALDGRQIQPILI